MRFGKVIIKNFIAAVILVSFFLSVEVGISQVKSEQKVSAQITSQDAWAAAKKLINEEKWGIARDTMRRFIDNYPESAYVDDAAYYSAYSYYMMAEENSNMLVEVFNSFEDFVENYPKSKWLDDAQTEMINIGLKLEEMDINNYMQKVKYLQQVKDDEIALMALYAVKDTDEKTLIPAMMALYTRSKSGKVRDEILSLIYRYKSGDATKSLIDIVTIDNDQARQLKAMSYLRRRDLDKHYEQFWDLLSRHNNPKVRYSALLTIYNNKAPNVVTAIDTVLFGDIDEDTEDDVMRLLLRLEEDKRLPLLIKAAKSHRNDEIRKTAISYLGRSKDPRAVQALLEIIKGK
ncbi:HEAT repeat domain-containing protein [candidate division KSB1 bacterium]